MYVLGIDIGSTASKAVVMTDENKIYAKALIPHGTGSIGRGRFMKKFCLRITSLRKTFLEHLQQDMADLCFQMRTARKVK